MNIPIDSIIPNPQQPRKIFDQAELENLAASIQEVGVINPISVEDNGDGTYTLVDGERRVRASRLAGLATIEASVKPSRNGTGESSRLAEALTANLQHSNMNVIEQAKAIGGLYDRGYRLPDIMRLTGFTQGPINMRMELLTFSPVIQDLFADGALPIDTRLIQTIKKVAPEKRDALLTRCVARKMSGSRIVAVITYSENLTKKNHTKVEDATHEIAGALDVTRNKEISEQLRTNVIAVCKRCGMASKAICPGCPVTDLLDMWK